jgi:hypothetical protein
LDFIIINIVAEVDVVDVVSVVVNQVKVISYALLLDVVLDIGDGVITSRECDVQGGSGSGKGKDKTEVLVVVICTDVVPTVWD